jgi:FlaA1/EpsC-like NDP-sugar epimerase
LVARTAETTPVDSRALDPIAHLAGKSIVVTGAGGSIGSELCQTIVRSSARRLTMVSLTENALYNLERRLRGRSPPEMELAYVLGSVLDRELMRETLKGADIVIHAAAHKHVPICEANPIAAIQNNVIGTLQLAMMAEGCDVRQFVLISSDKAVNPCSVMGATKRVAELMLRDRDHRITQYVIVRFGNVLDSAGSVLPLWREQIAAGGPLTLTDPQCERYFMSIPEAVELILGAIAMEQPGTFVFDMGRPRRMLDLAQELIRESGKSIAIRITGLRPGEKLTEELHQGGALEATAHPKIFRVDEGRPNVKTRNLVDLMSLVSARDHEGAVNLLKAMAACG